MNPDQNGGSGKGVLTEDSGEQSSSPAESLLLWGILLVGCFLLVGHLWFLPVDRKGKQPLQQDWKPLSAGLGFCFFFAGHSHRSAARLTQSFFLLNVS